MSDKKGKLINFSSQSIELVERYQKEHGCKNFTSALEQLIQDYYKNEDLETRISNKVSSDLYKVLTRIRLGSTSADINTQVIVEILNSIALSFEVQPMTTGVEEHRAVSIAKNYVREKIAKKKQKKDWDNIGKGDK